MSFPKRKRGEVEKLESDLIITGSQPAAGLLTRASASRRSARAARAAERELTKLAQDGRKGTKRVKISHQDPATPPTRESKATETLADPESDLSSVQSSTGSVGGDSCAIDKAVVENELAELKEPHNSIVPADTPDNGVVKRKEVYNGTVGTSQPEPGANQAQAEASQAQPEVPAVVAAESLGFIDDALKYGFYFIDDMTDLVGEIDEELAKESAVPNSR
jgi:hypothetical protein